VKSACRQAPHVQASIFALQGEDTDALFNAVESKACAGKDWSFIRAGLK
jgi:hypothetical protein